MRKEISILLGIAIFLVISFNTASFVNAQVVEPTGYANCDQCGLCQKDGVPQPTPQSYVKCKQCLYPNLAGPLDSLKIDTTSKLPPAPYHGNMYTVLGCLRTDAGEFTVQLSQLFFNVVGGIAFLFLLYGAVLIMASRASPERLNYGKRIVYAAITGLVFVLMSTLIIRFIAVDVLGIPGFGS